MASTKKTPNAPKAAAAKPTPKVEILNLVKDATPKFRKGSAREAYYNFMAKHAGKPITEIAALAEKHPPSQPKKGKLAGQTEPFAGWVGYMVRNGLFTLTAK